MERRLISLIQPFMKLIVLPYGQRALKGQIVNFPINTGEVCSSLPRTLDNAGNVFQEQAFLIPLKHLFHRVTFQYVGPM